MDFDLSATIRFHSEKGAIATIAVKETDQPWQVGILQLDGDGRVVSFVEKPPRGTEPGRLSNAGIYVFERSVLDYIPASGFCDFAYGVFPRMLSKGASICAYQPRPKDYLIDIGTPENCYQAQKDATDGRFQIGGRAVFLDRDGIIARDINYCRRPEDLEIMPTAPKAISLLNENGFKVVVVTNQSGIARGLFDEETLSAIHRKMLQDLSREGAKIDAIYYCPHHPDDGCQCRKPNPGMLLKAADELGIALGTSFMVGDMQSDIDAGRAVGCQTILVTTGPKQGFGVTDFDYAADSLVEATEWIIRVSKAKAMDGK